MNKENLLLSLFDASMEAVDSAKVSFDEADHALDAFCGKLEFEKAFQCREEKKARWMKAKEFEKKVAERISKYETGFSIDDLLFMGV